jgi:hypothetical protein
MAKKIILKYRGMVRSTHNRALILDSVLQSGTTKKTTRFSSVFGSKCVEGIDLYDVKPSAWVLVENAFRCVSFINNAEFWQVSYPILKAKETRIIPLTLISPLTGHVTVTPSEFVNEITDIDKFDTYEQFYLVDKLLNITTDLRVSGYEFDITTIGKIENRFELVFKAER